MALCPSHSHLLIIRWWLRPPAQPRHGDGHLDRPGNPQRSRHARLGALQPAAGDTADDHQDDSGDAPVPLDVLPHGRHEQGVGEQVAVERREHVGGDLVEAEDAARDDLAAELEGEEGHRRQAHVVGLVALQGGVAGGGAQPGHGEGGHGAALGQGGGEEDEQGLDQEGQRERGLALGLDPARLAEEEAARPEGGDGHEGLEPQGGGAIGEVGGSEGEEDGVSCWGMSVMSQVDTVT